MLASLYFCSNQAVNSPQKLDWGMVGDWHFDGSFGQSRGLNVCLFYWLCWASFCCTWAFSSCSKQKRLSSYLCAGFSLLGLLLLQSTGFGATGSVLVLHGLSCCEARGILPHQGSNPGPVRWQIDYLPLHHQGGSVQWLLTGRYV